MTARCREGVGVLVLPDGGTSWRRAARCGLFAFNCRVNETPMAISPIVNPKNDSNFINLQNIRLFNVVRKATSF